MDLKEFEQILRTETGEELETDEIRMVKNEIFKLNKWTFKNIGDETHRFHGRAGAGQGESKRSLRGSSEDWPRGKCKVEKNLQECGHDSSHELLSIELVTRCYNEGIISRTVVVDGILTDCDQKC